MLNLAAPAFLGLALLAVLVVLLHSQQKRRRVVGSLRFWRELRMPSGSQRTQLHRPRLSLPLILQIAAVLAIALALSQPFWGRSAAPDHLIVVVDASASMAVAEPDGTRRLELARAALSDQLQAAGTLGPERVSMLTADPRVRLVAARWLWSDDALAPILQELDTADGAADWTGFDRQLNALTREGERTQVLFVSADHAPEPLRTNDRFTLAELSIGSPRPRAAIEATVTAVAADENRWRVTGEVAFLDGLEDATVTISYAGDPDGGYLGWDEVALEAGETGMASFDREIELPGPGIVALSAPGDSGPRPMAWFVLDPQPRPTEVLYLGDGNQPLLRALQAQDGVSIFQADSLPEDLSRFALVVLDEQVVEREPETNTVWIGQARVTGAPEPAALLEPDPDYWTLRHPLARDIGWSELLIGSAIALPERPGSEVLLSAQGSALIQAETGPHGRSVRLAFNPMDSNWSEQSSFAIFAAGLIDWAGAAAGPLPRTACRVGELCAMPAQLAGTAVTPVDLEAGLPAQTLTADGFMPRHAGLYRYEADGEARLLAVNPALGGVATVEESPDGEIGFGLPQSWSLWLIAGAGALILADGWLAARGKRVWIRSGALAALATLAMVLAALDAPVPLPKPREVLMVVEAAAGPVSLPEAQTGPTGYAGPLIGLITAGAEPALVSDPSGRATLSEASSAAAIGHGEAALELARAAIPGGQSGRILLGGDLAVRPADPAALALAGIIVDHLPLAAAPAGEVTMRSLEVPPIVVAEEAVPLLGLIHAQSETPATLTIVLDGEIIAEQDVHLAAGHNRVETQLPGIADGDNLVEIEISAPGDTFVENNRVGRIVTARAARPIAVISPSAERGEAFAAMLEEEGLEAEVLAPNRAPHYYSGFLEYGGVVLLNTPAISLTTRQQGLLRDAVSQHGLGLLILGGENTFGPGGYFETPLEEVSPLSSRIPRDAPQIAMVFVLDRSGSMQQPVGTGNRLDVAKHATLSAMELLNPESDIGIVVFDGEARSILPIQKVDIAAAEAALSQVDPGGGTSIFPGLEMAWEMLRDIEAPARHVVVMTDGLSQPGDWPSILGQMTGAGVTVSAVAIGQGSDRGTVETIAALGGGAAHVTTDFEALPSILSQEAMLFSAPVEEGLRQPEWRNRNVSFLRNLPAAMPPIEGFVLTTAKPEAQLAMVTQDSEGEEAPLMALWRYGNGQVMAFTSDAAGAWTRHWHQLDGFGRIWSDALRVFQPPTLPPGFNLLADGDGEALQIRLVALDENGDPRPGMDLRAIVEGPARGDSTINLREDDAGIYRADVALDAPGRYEITAADPDDPEGGAALSYHHSYDVAYDFSRQSGAAAWLAEQTNGQVRTASEAIAAGAGLQWRWQGLWQIWVVIGLTLFMIDLFQRYGAFPNRRRQRISQGRTP